MKKSKISNKTKKINKTRNTKIRSKATKIVNENNKLLGIFISVCGMLGLIAIILFVINGIFSNIAKNNNNAVTVLGTSTAPTPTPTNFTATIKNYQGTMTWDNLHQGKTRQYFFWTSTTKNGIVTDTPRSYAWIADKGTDVKKISMKFDQVPGTTVTYKISTCPDCQLNTDGTIENFYGHMSAKSAAVSVSMPKVVAPSSFTVKKVHDGKTISWTAIPRANEYIVYHKQLFGPKYLYYAKVTEPSIFIDSSIYTHFKVSTVLVLSPISLGGIAQTTYESPLSTATAILSWF